MLQQRIAGPNPRSDWAESDAGVLLAGRYSGATLATDDNNCVRVLHRYVTKGRGHPWSRLDTPDTLDQLRAADLLSDDELAAVRTALKKKNRPNV